MGVNNNSCHYQIRENKMSEVAIVNQIDSTSANNMGGMQRQRKTSSTVDLRKMSRMHEVMTQQLETQQRHVDMREQLASLEKKNDNHEEEKSVVDDENGDDDCFE